MYFVRAINLVFNYYMKNCNIYIDNNSVFMQ